MGNESCSNGSGHMTKMAAMPIYIKKKQNKQKKKKKKRQKAKHPPPKKTMTLKVGMQYRVLECYRVCLNDDPELTLTYFTARSNLVPYAFVWGKGKAMNFSETVVVYDIKVGR